MHLDSLQFINSAGAWNRAGDRVALAAIRKGQPELIVLDVERNRTVREIELAELGEISSPTWAPDGRAIAFSAIVGGATDLYVYDLERQALRRLTDDLYTDLQPAWSPDGRRLAFVSDRFSTRLRTLDFRQYELAVIDVASGDIRRIAGFREGKHINPQWSPDGRALYFVSDRTGISNLYRLELASGRIAQLTNLTTGIAGITALSPAISVAEDRRLQIEELPMHGREWGQCSSIFTLQVSAP